MSAASLPYAEPNIRTILIQSCLILLLNIVNFVLDKALYCGLIGQFLLGIAWGTPGANWLDGEAQNVFVQLGYLGLLLMVYEGGLSTSLKALKANFVLSCLVALTGICFPIGFSFVLQRLMRASPLQAFSAGASLCSTSLGTTFAVLGTTGLVRSRLGVVLTGAAMMDDVVGLVMVQIISNLGNAKSAFSYSDIVRPLLVSIAFAICSPLVCNFFVRPATVWLNGIREQNPSGYTNLALSKSHTSLLIHIFVLIGLVAGFSYAGTSNLFAAYIAGACISWWDEAVPHPTFSSNNYVFSTGSANLVTVEKLDARSSDLHKYQKSSESTEDLESMSSGLHIYLRYYSQSVNTILRPLFFASIGFSIPITDMLRGAIIWKGLVYASLMIIAKLVCGLWLLKFSMSTTFVKRVISWMKGSKISYLFSQTSKFNSSLPPEFSETDPEPLQDQILEISEVNQRTPSAEHIESVESKSRSIYPASILGWAMVARGEIGFLISSVGEANEIFRQNPKSQQSSDIFLVVTWAIVLCTIVGPLAVGLLVRRVNKLQGSKGRENTQIRGDVLGKWGAFANQNGD
ncbi:Sodium/hydrogen exchanger family-domain-containing protein [Lipomyces oligophaga]|uniref:Sodium/hydrogen exchanger family-domain-containing protein n=1 Tax=Lipomyces oligophaga TaxID=45792 RepID=UPI0034CF91E9